MITSFSQPKDIYKVFFNTKYQYLEIFEELSIDNTLSISIHEIESQTIEETPDDIWCFEIYLSKLPDISLLKKQISKFVLERKLEIISNIELEKIPDRDWVTFYQNQLKPIEVGRFFIGAQIHKGLCSKDKIGIFIDASRAFGTGQHETSRGCIEALEQIISDKHDSILDIGTGTGILALAAEKLWPNAKIWAIDIDEISIEVAKYNAKFNNSTINFYKNHPSSILLPEYSEVKFNLIISNILALPLIELSSQILQLSAPGCYVVLSGFLDIQLDEVSQAYTTIGFETKYIIHKNSWIILVLQLTQK